MTTAGEAVYDLHFTIRNLPHRTGECEIRLGTNGPSDDVTFNVEVGNTDRIPIVAGIMTFQKSLRYVYQYGRKQMLVVSAFYYPQLSDVDPECVYASELELFSKVLCNGGYGELDLTALPAPLHGRPVVGIQAIQDEQTLSSVTLQLKGAHLCHELPLKAPYFALQLITEHSHPDVPVILYRSEAIESDAPNWQPFMLPIKFFPSNNKDYVEVVIYNKVNNKEDVVYGKFGLSIYQLLSHANGLDFNPRNPSLHISMQAVVHVTCLNTAQKPVPPLAVVFSQSSPLHLSIAVDFTTHNGNQHDATSLHYIHPHIRNAYYERLRRISEHLSFVNVKKVEMLGFGAVATDNRGSQTPSHCFALNGSLDQPYCRSDDVVEHYWKSAVHLMFHAPTTYANVIARVRQKSIAASRSPELSKLYFVLIILTNGNVVNNNMFRDSMNEVCKCSRLPISIVFVPVFNPDRPFAANGRFFKLVQPNAKSDNEEGLVRETASFVSGSLDSLADEVYNAIARQMIQRQLFKQ